MVVVRFILLYSEIAPTEMSCRMLQTVHGRKKYGEEMSGEQPHSINGKTVK